MNYTLKSFFLFLFANYKNHSIKIFLLSILETILEVFSVSVLILAISHILIGKNDLDNQVILFILNLFDFNFEGRISFFYLILIVYIFKNLLLVLINWLKLNYCGQIFSNLSFLTFQKLLKQNYLFLSNYSSGDMTQNILGESEYAKETIINIIRFFTEILIIFFMFCLLFFQNPLLGTKIILLISFSSILYFYFMKRKNISLGKTRQTNSISIINTILQALNMHKLIILRNKFSYFFDNFSSKIEKIYKVSRDQTIIQYAAHLWLEICILVALFFLLLPSIANFDLQNNISETILIIIISLRFIPSYSTILNSTSSIQYGQQAVSNVMRIILLPEDEIKSIKNKNIEIKEIEFQNINYKYLLEKNQILNNFNYKTSSKKLIGISGKNGSGKSTLCSIISGLNKPQSGKILVNGQSIYDEFEMLNMYRSCVGYVDQKFYFINDTIKKNIAFGEKDEQVNDDKVIECLQLVGMLDFFMSKNQKLNTLIGENGTKLSGGQLQKINVARALYANPQILILDEATNNLDVKNTEDLVELIRLLKKNMLIFLVSHSKDILDNCDDIINL